MKTIHDVKVYPMVSLADYELVMKQRDMLLYSLRKMLFAFDVGQKIGNGFCLTATTNGKLREAIGLSRNVLFLFKGYK